MVIPGDLRLRESALRRGTHPAVECHHQARAWYRWALPRGRRGVEPLPRARAAPERPPLSCRAHARARGRCPTLLGVRMKVGPGRGPNDSFCGGHSNAVGLRAHFDATSPPLVSAYLPALPTRHPTRNADEAGRSRPRGEGRYTDQGGQRLVGGRGSRPRTRRAPRTGQGRRLLGPIRTDGPMGSARASRVVRPSPRGRSGTRRLPP